MDELPRPLREPNLLLPKLDKSRAGNWRFHFDLLIDAQGKVVRVENISGGAPREVIGAVLLAFYQVPYMPAKLAGQSVAARWRIEWCGLTECPREVR